MKLAEIQYKESIEEMKHAELLIDRILFLEGIPNMSRYDPIRAGENVKKQFEHDLVLETNGVKAYNALVDLCVKLKDGGTRDLAEKILVDSEEHVDWLETQLDLISDIGLQNYLTEQMSGEEEEK